MTDRALVAATDPPADQSWTCALCGAQYYGRGAAVKCCSHVALDGGEVQRTRTTERVEAQTVEETDYYCPLCEQWYDEDEIVIVGIGPTKEQEDSVAPMAGYEKTDQLCAGCCDRLFEYDGYTGIRGEVEYQLDHWTWREMLSAGVSAAIAISPVIIGLTVAVTVVTQFFLELQQALLQPLPQAQPTGIPFYTVIEPLFPVFFLLTVIWVVVKMLDFGRIH